MNKSNTSIVIIDDELHQQDPLFVKLSSLYETVKLYNNTKSAIRYLKKNVNNKFIILLDILLSHDQLTNKSADNGHKTLEEIRKVSSLIPVILWTGVDETQEKFGDLINNNATSFVRQTESIEKIVNYIEKAEEKLETNLDVAIETWLQKHEKYESEEPYITTQSGESYTLRELVQEIRSETEVGRQVSKNMLQLVIGRLVRKKDTLDD